MPAIAEEIWRRIGMAGTPTDVVAAEAAAWGQYPGALAVTKGDPLFPRIAAD
jgi:methionyl-tRNA synthetase